MKENKQKKEKKTCKSTLHGKIKEGKDRGKFLIKAHTQKIPYLSTVTRQHMTRQRRVRSLLMSVKAFRHVGVS